MATKTTAKRTSKATKLTTTKTYNTAEEAIAGMRADVAKLMPLPQDVAVSFARINDDLDEMIYFADPIDEMSIRIGRELDYLERNFRKLLAYVSELQD